MLIRLLDCYCKDRKWPLSLLSIDQSKAFDRVHHGFLWHALKVHGVPSELISAIKILYHQAHCQCFVNGYLSEPFPIGKGVRQGCPLSMLLFSLCINLLLSTIDADRTISGYNLPGSISCKFVAHADDVTFFVRDARALQQYLHTFQLYCRASGALLNTSKSNILHLQGTFSIPP